MILSAECVRQGYAQVATFPPNVTYQALFMTLPREATRGLGGQSEGLIYSY
jgi:hypothetical protein